MDYPWHRVSVSTYLLRAVSSQGRCRAGVPPEGRNVHPGHARPSAMDRPTYLPGGIEGMVRPSSRRPVHHTSPNENGVGLGLYTQGNTTATGGGGDVSVTPRLCRSDGTPRKRVRVRVVRSRQPTRSRREWTHHTPGASCTTSTQHHTLEICGG